MMKRAGWKAVAVLSGAALATSFGFGATSAFADFSRSGVPTLVYDGSAKAFSYRNVENGDLFASFKDLMPGDHAQQEFSIEAVNVEEPVTIYVKASYEDAEVAGIEDIALSASFGDDIAVEGTVGDFHDMGDALELGVFAQDDVMDGVVELDVPTTLGNDSAGDERELVWTFSAQEEGGGPGPGPDPGPDPDPDPDPDPEPGPDPDPSPDPEPEPGPDPAPDPDPDVPDTDGDSGSDGSADGDGAGQAGIDVSDNGGVSSQSDAIAKTGDSLRASVIAWFAAAFASLAVLLTALRRLRTS